MSSKRRKIVITGCTSGVGKCLCELYCRDGRAVIGVARPAVEPDIAVNVADYDAVKAGAKSVAEKYGGIDTVIAMRAAKKSGATARLF